MLKKMQIRTQIILAILLMGFFYALIASVLISSVGFPWLYWRQSGQFSLVVAAISWGISVFTVWSIVYRKKTGKSQRGRSGFPLELSQHPKLMELLTEIATKTKCEIPETIVLNFGCTAFVAEERRFFRKKRIVGIGLPLFFALTIQEFKAVLGHEFWHFLGGDTGWGGWAYRQRGLVKRMSDFNGLFAFYSILFLKLTQAVSRAQELEADRFAAIHAGGEATASSLEKLADHYIYFTYFWENAIQPAFKNGFRPPIQEGYDRFIGDSGVMDWLNKQKQGLTIEIEDDAHPLLQERLKAIRSYGDPSAHPALLPASALFENWLELERKLFQSYRGQILLPIAWDDVWEKIFIPVIERKIAFFGDGLSGIPFRDAKALLDNPRKIIQKIFPYMPESVTENQLGNEVVGIISDALLLCLYKRDWFLPPTLAHNEETCLRKGKTALRPEIMIKELAVGKMSAEEWMVFCKKEKIEDWDMGSPGHAVIKSAELPAEKYERVRYDGEEVPVTRFTATGTPPPGIASWLQIIFLLVILLVGLSRCVNDTTDKNRGTALGRFLHPIDPWPPSA